MESQNCDKRDVKENPHLLIRLVESYEKYDTYEIGYCKQNVYPDFIAYISDEKLHHHR